MIKELERESTNILTTINMIDDISERTNILSMNAAIEAARAGRSGEGFGIIAKEIRNLSSNTKKNSNEIRSNLSIILNKIKVFVEDFNILKEQLEKIMDYSTKTKAIVHNITDAIKEENASANSIVGSTKELNNYKDNINNISENQKSMSEKIKRSCEELEAVSNNIIQYLKTQDTRNSKFVEIVGKLKDISEKNVSISNLLSDSIKKR